ncbi:MAG: hypothetical protein LBB74_05315 [Chitinispirillales bacterium]|jgi:PIN domain nuclease of toxin-antitoxin system|nr:hypothetical protein [Chitinispirillales bacterium]
MMFPDHKDPAGRIIIAQDVTEKTQVDGGDGKLRDYRRDEGGLGLIKDRGAG